MGKTILFVYGTLKRNMRNHHLIANQQFLGTAITEACYRLVDLGRYPGLIEDHRTGLAVHGELWAVDEPCLQQLDEFEGVPNLFIRRPVAIPGWEGITAYFWNCSVVPGAASGDKWPFAESHLG